MAMKLVELGAELGVTKAQVSRLAARGMPTDSVDAARAWRAKNLHPSWSDEARGAVGPGVAESGTADYWASRARKEAAQAELAEIELARAKQGLLEVDRVQRALFATHRMLRDQLLAVPNRLAAQVVGVTPAAAAELMRTEVRSCLESFGQLSNEALVRLLEDEVAR